MAGRAECVQPQPARRRSRGARSGSLRVQEAAANQRRTLNSWPCFSILVRGCIRLMLLLRWIYKRRVGGIEAVSAVFAGGCRLVGAVDAIWSELGGLTSLAARDTASLGHRHKAHRALNADTPHTLARQHLHLGHANARPAASRVPADARPGERASRKRPPEGAARRRRLRLSYDRTHCAAYFLRR
jgi:hypothetical protein